MLTTFNNDLIQTRTVICCISLNKVVNSLRAIDHHYHNTKSFFSHNSEINATNELTIWMNQQMPTATAAEN